MTQLSQVVRVELDRELERHQSAIEKIADRSVRRCVQAFKSRYPKRSLKIVFGMGTELIRIDDKQVTAYWNPATESCVWEPGTCRGKIIPASWSVTLEGHNINPKILDFICVMLDELMEITDGYRRGCPDDVEADPEPEPEVSEADLAASLMNSRWST